jgi:hypothetical protein
MTKTLEHWKVTVHGVATPEDVERCIVKIAEKDAALAYRLEGYVAVTASRIEELERALRWSLEYIDAIPADTPLPAMPGFDRDYANDLLARSALSDKG